MSRQVFHRPPKEGAPAMFFEAMLCRCVMRECKGDRSRLETGAAKLNRAGQLRGQEDNADSHQHSLI